MKTNLISCNSAVREFIRSTGHQGELDRMDIIAWANDGASRIITDEQYIHKVVLLDVQDYRARLPEDFRYIIQAAYQMSNTKPCTREEVAEWTDKQFGCKVEIKLECPGCHNTSDSCTCAHKTDALVINADRLWQSSHPEYKTAYMKHFTGYGNMTSRNTCYYHPHFNLMRAGTGSFSNLQYHIRDCMNLHVDTQVEYTLNLPNIIVNFKEGRILLAYMAIPLDEDGYRMIPNEPIAIEAISKYITEKYLYREYLKDFSQGKRLAWQAAEQLKEKYIGRARAELQMPTFDEMYPFIKGFVHRLIPRYNFESDLNRGTSHKSDFKYTSETENLHGDKYNGR